MKKNAINIFPIIMTFLTLLPLDSSATDFSKALQATINNHPDIKAKIEELNAHQSSIKAFQAAYYPTISAEINNINDNYQQGTIKLQQPIYTFGKTSTAIDLAQSRFNSQHISLLILQRQLLEQTSIIYAQKVGIQQKIKISQTNVEEHQQLLNHINRRQQGKLAAEVDVSLGQSRLLLARSQMQKLKGGLTNIETELKTITGTNSLYTDDIPQAIVQLQKPSELIQMALDNSAEIAHQLALADESKITIKNKQVSIYPNLLLRAEHDFLDDSLTGDNTRIGLSLEASYEGLGTISHHQVNEEAAKYANLLMKSESIKQDISKQMMILMDNRQLNQQQLKTQDKAIDMVKNIMQSYFRLYKSGRKSWIDVLNIQREITELRLQRVELNTQWFMDSLRIASLIGQLDKFAGINYAGMNYAGIKNGQ